MKLLIATPLNPTQSGGPAQYTVQLRDALVREGHEVTVVPFSDVRGSITGVRHLRYFCKLWVHARNADGIIILDTFSVALPAVIAGWILRKMTIVRTGGDFVWEQYVERTGESVRLSEFYAKSRHLGLKGRISFLIQKYVVAALPTFFVFSTEWQSRIWNVPYRMKQERVRIIENAYAHNQPSVARAPRSNDIVWIGRDLVLKNRPLLQSVMKSIVAEHPGITFIEYTQASHDVVMSTLASCRALILPSLSEVSPNLAIEALSLGTPVVLTNDCGLRSTLGDSVIWVDTLSRDDVQRGVGLVADDATYTDVQKRALSFHVERTYEDVARDFLSLLTQTVSK